MQHSMRMFRAQRNFYISGFTMFLVLVIRRLVILISQQAAAADESEVVKRQAASATSAARTLLSQQKLQEELQQQPAGRGDETDRTMENQRIQFLVSARFCTYARNIIFCAYAVLFWFCCVRAGRRVGPQTE